MNAGSYSFPLGNFLCICLSDGSLDYPLQNFFANAAIDEVENALREGGLPTDYITTPYTYLFVDTRDHQVLIDMGAGDLGPRTGKLMDSIRAAGIDPLAIDTVVISHAHPDHVGGTLDHEGALNFPNASYYISKPEWDFWFSETVSNQVPESFVITAHRNLNAIEGRLTLVEGEAEIVPGIHTIPAPGHTPGHMVVGVVSGAERLFYIGDAVLYPLHLEHPDWLPVYDIQPEKAEASKRQIFDRAAQQGTLVVGQHFPPFPSLGVVAKFGEGWRWSPVEVKV